MRSNRPPDSKQDGQEDASDRIDRMIQHIHIRTRLEKVMLAMRATAGVMTPILFLNALPNFLRIQQMLQEILDNNFYYYYTMPAEVRYAVTLDGATVAAEAYGITTPLIIFGAIPASVLALIYQARKYCKKREKINQLVELLEAKEFGSDLKLRLLEIPTKTLDALIACGAREDAINTIEKIESSSWEHFAETVIWHNEALHKYSVPIMALSVIPGLYFMLSAMDQLNGKLECSTSPLFALFMDNCGVTEHYDLMSLLTYVWDSISLAYLSTYTLGLASRIVMHPFQNTREWFQNKIDTPFQEWLKEDNWVMSELAWQCISIPAMPLIVAYAFSSAKNLVDRYAQETGCPAMVDLVSTLIFGNSPTKRDICSTAQMSLSVSGFLSDFEIGKFYAMFLALKLLSYLIGLLIEKSHPYFRRADTQENAKRFIKHLKDIYSTSSKAAFIGMIISGSAFFFIAKRASDQILQEGLSIPFHFDNLPLPIPKEVIEEYISRITFIDDHTVAFRIADACLTESTISIFLKNLLWAFLDAPECDPILTVRNVATFVAIYWLGVSFTTGGMYFLTATGMLGFSALRSLYHSVCAPQHAYEALPQSDEEAPAPQPAPSLDPTEEEMEPRGCLHRFQASGQSLVNRAYELLPSRQSMVNGAYGLLQWMRRGNAKPPTPALDQSSPASAAPAP